MLLFHQVEKELKEICRDVLDILDKHLIPAAGTGESKVFYYKMYVHHHCCYDLNELIQDTPTDSGLRCLLYDC